MAYRCLIKVSSVLSSFYKDAEKMSRFNNIIYGYIVRECLVKARSSVYVPGADPGFVIEGGTRAKRARNFCDHAP